ncbi:hypothetical protein [Peptostreptococcus porci]|nr:hypothetical protein [Peptostreptococcus porci]MDY5435526.1 hypothetical protein [Peptostreptococcus porci]
MDDKKIDLSLKEEIIKICESRSITIRSVSKNMKVPLMITFLTRQVW